MTPTAFEPKVPVMPEVIEEAEDEGLLRGVRVLGGSGL